MEQITNGIRVVLLACCLVLTACGGGNDTPSASSSSLTSQSLSSSTSQSSSSSSFQSQNISTSQSSSSSSVLLREKIDFADAPFFNEPGLWVAFTEYLLIEKDMVQAEVKNAIHFAGTSLNTFLFTSDPDITPGGCIRGLGIEPSDFRFRRIFGKPMGSMDYLLVNESLIKETNGSYTVEYEDIFTNKIIGTTRLAKISNLQAFSDFGLTISGTEAMSACVNWSGSRFERWLLDDDGNSIELIEGSYFSDMQLRRGLDNNSIVYDFSEYRKWENGTFAIVPFGSLGINAHALTAYSGIDWVPGKHFSAATGELAFSRFEPLKISGSFIMQNEHIDGRADVEVSGSFVFDYDEYFE